MEEERKDKQADAFISYSHIDKDWVNELVSKLSKERIGNRPVRLDMDEVGFVPGYSLVESIEKGVLGARKLVPILSPAWVASDWTALEASLKIREDPAGRKGLIIPVLYRDCEVPPSLWIRICADFRKKENSDRAYKKLVRALTGENPDTVQPTSSLESSEASKDLLVSLSVPSELERSNPDEVVEPIALNLFPVKEMPSIVWSAEGVGPQRVDVLNAIGFDPRIPFVMWEKKLWTFEDLQSPPSKLVRGINGTSEYHNVKKLLGDREKRTCLVSLLNQTIRTFLGRKGIRFDSHRRRYYFLPDYGKEREVPWPGLKSSRSRSVARIRRKSDGSIYWIHHSAEIRFVESDNIFHLEILPSRCVTIDGYQPMGGPKVGPLVTQAMRRVYNHAFWLDVMFWLYQFDSHGQLLIPTGSDDIELCNQPLNAETTLGIFGETKGFLGDSHLERWIDFADRLEEEGVEDESDEEII